MPPQVVVNLSLLGQNEPNEKEPLELKKAKRHNKPLATLGAPGTSSTPQSESPELAVAEPSWLFSICSDTMGFGGSHICESPGTLPGVI